LDAIFRFINTLGAWWIYLYDPHEPPCTTVTHQPIELEQTCATCGPHGIVHDLELVFENELCPHFVALI